MKKNGANDFLVELFALILIVTVVQAVWVTVVRPRDELIRQQDVAAMARDPAFVPERHMVTILKDYEPETCVILTLWSLFIIGYKARGILRSRRLLDTEMLSLAPGVHILPEDSREYARQIEALPPATQSELLPRALLSALHRFGATRSVQDAASAVRDTCLQETDRLDSELSMVRFAAWAIPAIGFVGTVRGIGESLQQAHKAVEGDVSGVVAGLGTSFNATLVALSLSILVMLCLHQMQLLQERMVLYTYDYLDNHVLRHPLIR